MHAFRRRKPRARLRRRNQSRPYLIDIEDFETVEDLEMDDWMFGISEGVK